MGLWSRYDPEEYGTIGAFMENPEKVWKMLKEMMDLIVSAEPNPGHTALAELEEMGVLRGVVTQNIDGLHQRAGSRNVVEFHGHGRTLSCMKCGSRYPAEVYRQECPPRCECGEILRPDFVFFGEPIPMKVQLRAHAMAESGDVLLLIGTSGIVMPAAQLPLVAKARGAKIIEVNLEPTAMSNIADIKLFGSSTEIMPELLRMLRESRG